MKFDLNKLSKAVFTMRATGLGSPDDWTILVDGIVCGRIMKHTKADTKEVWLWTVTGPYIPPPFQPGNGECETLEQAQAAFKVKMKSWLGHAWATGGGLWNGDMVE